LRTFELELFRKYPPHLLSGGLMQKTALSAVMAMKPDYLILDEPTSLLDSKSRKEFTAHIKSLPPAIGVIFITQYAKEAEEFERLVVLSKGAIIFDGFPEDFFREVERAEKAGIQVPVKYRF
jgi:energy-coupling factor transport system ATP-binding protein